MKKIISLIFISIFLLALYIVNFGKNNSVSIIKQRGVILVGTTGDYQPMSFFDNVSKTYTGFDIALSEDLANSLGVKVKYIKTSWPNLMKDTINGNFDLAISGITITKERKKQALMSNGYINNGKTVLCRKEDANKYININAINKPNVRVMENPGGLNEKFARENLPDAQLIIHPVNEEIPELIAQGKADVMITEIMEALYYSNKNPKLAAPIVDSPFTKGQIGILIPPKNKSLLRYVNGFIKKEDKNGRLHELKKIYYIEKNGAYQTK